MTWLEIAKKLRGLSKYTGYTGIFDYVLEVHYRGEGTVSLSVAAKGIPDAAESYLYSFNEEEEESMQKGMIEFIERAEEKFKAEEENPIHLWNLPEYLKKPINNEGRNDFLPREDGRWTNQEEKVSK